MSHQCPAPGCEEIVEDRLLMCRRDWFRVPRAVRSAVLRAYASGQGLGSTALLNAQQLAIESLGRGEDAGAVR